MYPWFCVQEITKSSVIKFCPMFSSKLTCYVCGVFVSGYSMLFLWSVTSFLIQGHTILITVIFSKFWNKENLFSFFKIILSLCGVEYLLKKFFFIFGLVWWLYWLILLLQAPTSHMGMGSCPSCSIYLPALCLQPGKAIEAGTSGRPGRSSQL